MHGRERDVHERESSGGGARHRDARDDTKQRRWRRARGRCLGGGGRRVLGRWGISSGEVGSVPRGCRVGSFHLVFFIMGCSIVGIFLTIAGRGKGGRTIVGCYLFYCNTCIMHYMYMGAANPHGQQGNPYLLLPPFLNTRHFGSSI